MTAPDRGRTLIASLNSRTVGWLTESGNVWSFQYHPDWLSASDRYAISPALPMGADPIVDGASTRPVQWFFDNLLPEQGVRRLLAKEARVSDEDAWGLLAYIGAESAGALTLLPLDATPPPGGLRPLPNDELQRRIDALPRQSLSTGAPKKMSLAGAQHKLPVCLRDGELLEPIGSESSTHILKPDSHVDGYPHTAVNEYFCMKLAERLKLPVPRVELRHVPAPIYLVTRFDRIGTVNPVERLHTFDGAQLLSVQSGQKYKFATAGNLAQCLGHCRTKARDRTRIFRWVVFNILIGNGDAHLKNLSFLVTSAGIELAPFYDLVSTVVYHTKEYLPEATRWPDVELSMQTGKAARFSEITRNDVIEAGVILGLKPATARQQVDELCRHSEAEAGQLMIEVFAGGTLNAGEQRIVRMIPALPIAEMVARLR